MQNNDQVQQMVFLHKLSKFKMQDLVLRISLIRPNLTLETFGLLSASLGLYSWFARTDSELQM